MKKPIALLSLLTLLASCGNTTPVSVNVTSKGDTPISTTSSVSTKTSTSVDEDHSSDDSVYSEGTSSLIEEEEDIVTSVEIIVPNDITKNDKNQYVVEAGTSIALSSKVFSNDELFSDQGVEWSSSQTLVATVQRESGIVNFLAYQGDTNKTVVITCTSSYEPLISSKITFYVYPMGKFPGSKTSTQIFEEAWKRPNNNGCDTLFYRNWLNGNGPGCSATLTSWDSKKVQVRVSSEEAWKIEYSFDVTGGPNHDRNFLMELYPVQIAKTGLGFDDGALGNKNPDNQKWTCRGAGWGWNLWCIKEHSWCSDLTDQDPSYTSFEQLMTDCHVKLTATYNPTDGKVTVNGDFTANNASFALQSKTVVYTCIVPEQYRNTYVVFALGGDGDSNNPVTLKNVQAALLQGKIEV